MKRKTMVAIFEDNKIDQYILQKVLSPLEDAHQFVYFDNLEKALAIMEKTDFDVIVADLHFRGENFSGIKIFLQVKSLIMRPVIGIAITSYLQSGDLDKATASGFTRCLEKGEIFKKIAPGSSMLFAYQFPLRERR